MVQDRLARQSVCRYLKYCLGSNVAQPEDVPDIPQFWLVERFTSVTNAVHKPKIIRLFKEESKLKVVVATIAFSMGIDCPNVRQIIYDIVGLVDHTYL